MYIPQVVRKRGNEGVVEVENCGVTSRHAPDVDAEKGWRESGFLLIGMLRYSVAGRISWRGFWGWGRKGLYGKEGKHNSTLEGGGGEYSSRLHIIGLPLRSMRCVVPAFALHQSRARA